MALILSDYTSNDVIRGLLGVAETEIENADFTTLQPSHLLEVTFALEELNETIPTLFETIKGIAAGDRTLLQARFYSLVQVYAAYVIADIIANGQIAMFAPQKIEDGKAAQERQDDPYEALRAALKASLLSWRTRLGRTLTLLDATQSIAASATRTLVGSAGLALDPVTGV